MLLQVEVQNKAKAAFLNSCIEQTQKSKHIKTFELWIHGIVWAT